MKKKISVADHRARAQDLERIQLPRQLGRQARSVHHGRACSAIDRAQKKFCVISINLHRTLNRQLKAGIGDHQLADLTQSA
jgi:hypothetical protein